MTTDHSARARLESAFAAEERRGLMLASGARSAAALVVVAWLAVVNPERGAGYAWVIGTASLFLVTGLAQLWLYWPRIADARDIRRNVISFVVH